jgi:starch synthase (maltosyl-transferring)
VPVCLVITDLNVGGAEKALVYLALGLNRKLWKVSVINLGGEEPLAQVLRQEGVEVRCLAVSKRKPVEAIRKLAKALKDLQPALVQTFMFHANVAGRLGARLASVPWVLGGLRVAEHQKAWHLTVDRLTAKMSLGSVCVSEGVRRFSQTYGGLSEKRLIVIPNGVDVRPFDQAKPIDRKALGLSESDRISLFAGRLDAQKGLPYLLDAAELVAQKHKNWHLVMMGHDGSESEWFHERRQSSPVLQKHLHWLGFRTDVREILKSSDLLILPSLWEGMPNVVLEAMAAGKAVIGTDVEGTNELILPEQTGWIVPPENAQALADALMESIQKPDLTKKFGIAGRLRVEQNYTLERTIEAYSRLWSDVLHLQQP